LFGALAQRGVLDFADARGEQSIGIGSGYEGVHGLLPALIDGRHGG
jgi:hypothetical protein